MNGSKMSPGEIAEREACGCYMCVGGLYAPAYDKLCDRVIRQVVGVGVAGGPPVVFAEGVPAGSVVTLPLSTAHYILDDSASGYTVRNQEGTHSVPIDTRPLRKDFNLSDVIDAQNKLERASYSERERKQLERHARAFHPSMDFALEPHESPTVTIEGEELPAITVKPYRFELLALKLTRRKLEIRPSWFQAPIVVEGKQSEPSSWLRCTAVVRVVDRDNPRLLRELNAVREAQVDPEREIGAQAAALAWSLLEQLVLHELKETFFVDGRHFRDPEPEHG